MSTKNKNKLKVLALVEINIDKDNKGYAFFKTDKELSESELTKLPYDYKIVSKHFGSCSSIDEKFDLSVKEYNKYEYTPDKKLVKSLSKNIFIFTEKVEKNE